MCAHIGGQYNSKPTEETKKLVDKFISYGVNAVIGNHEHVIHNCDLKQINNNIIKTYSLGNFSGLAGVLKAPYDKLAEYSIIFNMYMKRNKEKINVYKCTFSIAKSVCIGKDKIKTVLLYDLINKCENKIEKEKLIDENLKIYNLFLNKKCERIDISKEYNIN